MAQVPSELILDILLWLPVKSLLRFRRVSKAWCELIDSDDFVKRHINHSIRFNNNHKLVLSNTESTRSFGLYSLQPLDKHHLPVNSNSLVRRCLVGSSNGLLCMYYHGRSDSVSFNPFTRYDSLLVIWNPFTRKHVKVRFHGTNPDFVPFNAYHAYGFGYDSVSDDYKVVWEVWRGVYTVMGSEISYETMCETCVYSLRSNSWKQIPWFPVDYSTNSSQLGTLACGALHWVVEIDEAGFRSYSVVAFDLGTEEQKMITLPDFKVDFSANVSVSELGSCLTCLTFKCDGSEEVEYCLWVMKDYGIRESWIKLCTISSNTTSVGFGVDVYPLAYSENGDEVLLKSIGVLWYNLEKKTMRSIEMVGLCEYSDLIICLESLVSLGGQAENDEEQEAQKRNDRMSGKNMASVDH